MTDGRRKLYESASAVCGLKEECKYIYKEKCRDIF